MKSVDNRIVTSKYCIGPSKTFVRQDNISVTILACLLIQPVKK